MNAGLVPFLLATVAAAAAAATYFLQGRPARPLWPAVAGRGLAWGTLVLLLLNPGCGVGGIAVRPVVLVDSSLSLRAAGGQASALQARADSLGEVRAFHQSRLRPALVAAAASARPVVILTDGEIHDATDLPADLLQAASVELFPRQPVRDLAITRARAPRWLPAADTLQVSVSLEGVGLQGVTTAPVTIAEGGRRLAAAEVSLDAEGSGEAVLLVPGGLLPPGDRVLEVTLEGHTDDEPRTDRRHLLVSVVPSPGVVLAAAVPGWESRFLYQSLVAVAGAPVRGFVQVEPGSWRTMGTLAQVSAAEVAAVVRRADLLVTLGDPVPGAAGAGARGRWEWPLAAPLAGDWFLVPDPGAPGVAGLAAVPPESLPPATGLAPVQPGAGDWVGFRAQLSRRGAERPAVIATVEGGRRRVIVGAAGLWRWAFRGGLAEQAYRVWVAETVTWLLGGSTGDGDRLRVPQPVVPQDAPVTFEWTGSVPDSGVVVTWAPDRQRAPDTLAFDGEGRATLVLPPGAWPWRIGSGESGTIVVEEYSPEFLPGPVTLEARAAVAAVPGPPRRVRELPWLFAIPALAWCLEWWTRRRAGLR